MIFGTLLKNGNLITGQKFFDTAINLGIKKFIICSSFSVYGKTKKYISERENLNPKNFYGLSKQLSEIIINSNCEINSNVKPSTLFMSSSPESTLRNI